MTISIIFLVLLLLVAYMHFIQGLLSGFISAVVAVVAGAIAFSYYEPLALAMSGGKFNDSAQSVCILGIFALSYLILRSIIDAFVPGNIRVNSTFDKVGGAVFGLVAGMIGLGIAAVALQLMPFGPSVGGYSRYPLQSQDRDIRILLPEGTPKGGKQINRLVLDELKTERLEKSDEASGMLIPFDDFVIALYGHLSNNGALNADKPFKSIHPDLAQEMFAQRIGIETGARHTASNKKDQQVKLVDLHVLGPKVALLVTPGESSDIRDGEYLANDPAKSTARFTPKPQPPRSAAPGKSLVIVGVTFASGAADESESGDRLVRMGASGIRLCGHDTVTDEWKNYYPIGTLEDGKIWICKPDDFLIFNPTAGDNGARFVFEVDEAVASISGKPPKPVIGSGAFIEVKRLVKIGLDEVTAEATMPREDRKFWPMRKFIMKKPLPPPAPGETATTPTPPVAVTPTPPVPTPPDPTPTPTPTPPTPTPPTPVAGDNGWNEAPLTKPELVAAGAQLPLPINVGEATPDVEFFTTSASTGSVKARKFTSLDTAPSVAEAAPAEMAKGSPVKELAAPAGQRVVQVKFTPKTPADWTWAAKLADYTIVDQEGKIYKPHGGLTVATLTAGGQRISAKYEADKEVANLNKVDASAAGAVHLFFTLPAASKAVEIRYMEKTGGPVLEK